MKVHHLMMGAILVGFAAFAVLVGCSQQTPLESGFAQTQEDAGSSQGMAPTAAARKKATRKKARVYAASLQGSSEVPAVETAAQGRAHFVFKPGDGVAKKKAARGDELKYSINVRNISDVTGAHIHLGAAGENGPVAAFLFSAPENGEGSPGRISDEGSELSNSGSSLSMDNGLLAKGILTDGDVLGGMTLAELIAEIEAGNTYVNVHTIGNPGGEIRGQIGENGRRQSTRGKKTRRGSRVAD